MKILKAALICSLLLPAAGAFAQEVDAPEMLKGLSMIQTNAQNAFLKYGIDANPEDLSLGQLGAIVGILGDPEKDSGGNSAKASIEALLRNQ